MNTSSPSTPFVRRVESSVAKAGAPLCIGLDTELTMMPADIASAANPILEFNRRVITATSDLAAAYKLNLAFYEADGVRGIDALMGTLEAIPSDVIVIGDAKRGDIGNTARMYAEAMFSGFGFDATTVSPYMGTDSLEPFFTDSSRGVFVLALTSNPGSSDFQRIMVDGRPIYHHVIQKCMDAFGDTGALGFVVGATHPNELREIRATVGNDVPLLIPGLGSQGGETDATLEANGGGIALCNVSRGVLRAGTDTPSFDAAIRAAAVAYHDGLAVSVGGN